MEEQNSINSSIISNLFTLLNFNNFFYLIKNLIVIDRQAQTSISIRDRRWYFDVLDFSALSV